MLSKVKGVAIELKFGSHTKRFHLPRTSSSVDDFLRQVQTTFGFSGTIIGFKDPNGKTVLPEEFLRRPEDLRPNEVHIVVIERPSSTPQIPVSGVDLKAHMAQTTPNHGGIPSTSKSQSLLEDLEEIEQQLKSNGLTHIGSEKEFWEIRSRIKVIFLLGKREDLVQLRDFIDVMVNFSNRICFCLGILSQQFHGAENLILLNPPAIGVFNNNERVIELLLQTNPKSLKDILSKLTDASNGKGTTSLGPNSHANTNNGDGLLTNTQTANTNLEWPSSLVQSTHLPKESQSNRASTNNIKLTRNLNNNLGALHLTLDGMANDNKINDAEYYYLKCLIYEESPALLTKFGCLQSENGVPAKTNNEERVDLFLEFLAENFTKTNGVKEPTPTHANQVFSDRPQTSQAEVRPDKNKKTRGNPNGGKNRRSERKKNKELSVVQERFIQVIANLEEKLAIDERTSSIIKTLVLDENVDVFRIINTYLNEVIDEKNLCKKLYTIAEKNDYYFERPNSPLLPRKDAIMNFVNLVARQHLRDEKDFEILIGLINSGEEMLYSAFEVFESDPDQDDLLDTILRIINKVKEMKEHGENNNFSGFYQQGTQTHNHEKKSRAAHEDLSGIHHAADAAPQIYSNGNGHSNNRNNHYRPKESRTRHINPKSYEHDSNTTPPMTTGYLTVKLAERLKRRKSSTTPPDEAKNLTDQNLKGKISKILEVMKAKGELNSFLDEEHGTLYWLLEKEDQRLGDVYVSCRDTFDRQGFLEKTKEISRSVYNETLRENFTPEDITLITNKRNEGNSLISNLCMLFKHHNNLPNLIDNLVVLIKNYRETNLVREIAAAPLNTAAKKAAQSQMFMFKEDEIKPAPPPPPRRSSIQVPAEERLNTNVGYPQERTKKSQFSPKRGDSVANNQQQDSSFNEAANKAPGGALRLITVVSGPNGKTENPAPDQEDAKMLEEFKEKQQKHIQESAAAAGSDLRVRKKHKYANLAIKPKQIGGGSLLKLMKTNDELIEDSGREQHASSGPINSSSDCGSGTSWIERYYDNVAISSNRQELFYQMLEQADFLTPGDKLQLESLYKQGHRTLDDALSIFEHRRQVEDVRDLLKHVTNPDSDGCIDPSPKAKRKLERYRTFRALLTLIKDHKKLITEKQYNTFIYFFMREEPPVLAAFEVYILSNDLTEFIDTLYLIEKVAFFKEDHNIEVIRNDFDQIIEKQMRLLYSIRSFLNLKTRVILEKLIRSGEMSLLKAFQDYKKNGQTRNELVNTLVTIANSKQKELKEQDRLWKEERSKQENINNQRRGILEALQSNLKRKGVYHLQILFEALDNNNDELNSIYEVYTYTKDKMDFCENVTLLYQKLYKESFHRIVMKIFSNFESKEKLEKLIDSVREKHSATQSAFDCYLISKDENDLASTLNILLDKV